MNFYNKFEPTKLLEISSAMNELEKHPIPESDLDKPILFAEYGTLCFTPKMLIEDFKIKLTIIKE